MSPSSYYRPFRERRFLQALCFAFAIFWVYTAIAPHDRFDWLLANIFVVIAAIGLPLTYRKYPFSDFSYFLIALYTAMHELGAYFRYERAPMGLWMQSLLGGGRNDWDRVVHFAFGLLLSYPIHEIYVRHMRARPWPSYYRPVIVTIAVSAVYEILQVYEQQIVQGLSAPILLQDETWDCQRDMMAAIYGSLVAMAITAAVKRKISSGAAIDREAQSEAASVAYRS